MADYPTWVLNNGSICSVATSLLVYRALIVHQLLVLSDLVYCTGVQGSYICLCTLHTS
jgi:hypothetical protein